MGRLGGFVLRSLWIWGLSEFVLLMVVNSVDGRALLG